MAQSGNGAEFESDVISLGTGQKLNFGDDTLKGKDSYNCEQCITKRHLTQKTKGKKNKIHKKDNKPSFENIQHTEVFKESKSLNIISTEGVFFIFYLDQAFPRICGRVYHLWQNDWLFW